MFNISDEHLSADLNILQEYCAFNVFDSEHRYEVAVLLDMCYFEYKVTMRYFCDEIMGAIYQNVIDAM
jgi:hypothetical protein